MKDQEPQAYWERAGELSYASAMFSHSEIENHVNQRLWQVGIEIGHALGLNEHSHILDLGCGDGTLANTVLAKHFGAIDGFDLSTAAINRAKALAAHQNMRFEARDITQMDYSQLPQYDGAYLWGILHHVKQATPQILQQMRHATKKIVILEPNGNHLMRKLLEYTKPYKQAGEDSFRTREMVKIFHQAGFRPVIWKRLNLFPNFTPKLLFNTFKRFEPLFENTPVLRAFCTVNMWGFTAYE